ncbi:capZ-interacting protein-like isoform X2 [Hypanus sabinus]|nr:capZ-interacting protein-like isoform X2 [Hypanus sabinus]XP_059824487.1 capZ-interacting protein-like isoform X2 [Hypanus sabinus]XP_059824488.1 capZ-interacting protein-like isoform X2 [Hypanus sabinus]
MEEKPLSVAAIASKFSHKTSDTVEKDKKCPRGPIRKKPPCSLPLFGNNNSVKTESDHNGNEKQPANEACHHPKLKLKISSPHIEKLQAALLISPAALMPGAGPKSPLKPSASPFASPASTPESPGARSVSSESDGTPATGDQPKEAETLQSLHKTRARLSIKRRPPSRRFRRSISDDVGNSGSSETEQLDNSAKQEEPKQSEASEEGNDEVFIDKVQNGNTHSSAEGEAHTSPHLPADHSSEEPEQKMPSDPLSSQSQESEICTAKQDEDVKDYDIDSKITLESADKDNETSDNIVHNPAGSETVVSEMADQELKTEEVNATDIEQQIDNAEDVSSGAINNEDVISTK